MPLQHYNTQEWSVVDLTGGKFIMKELFLYVTMEGEKSTTPTVRNQSADLNERAVFCNFRSDNDKAKTNRAFFCLSAYVPTCSQPVYSVPGCTVSTNAIPCGVYFGGYGFDENGTRQPYDASTGTYSSG